MTTDTSAREPAAGEKREAELGENTAAVPRRAKKPRHRYKAKQVEPTSPQGVLRLEIEALLAREGLSLEQVANDMPRVLNEDGLRALYHREVVGVRVRELTLNGEGLCLVPHPEDGERKQVVVVPFGYPGEVVTVRTFKTHPYHVEADLVKVESVADAAPYKRDDSLIRCQYFGKCSGCQYQNVDYDTQLEIKRMVIVNAFKHFAPVLSKTLPAVGPTYPLPEQYGYRTKLTPHFDVPRKRSEPYYRPQFGFGAKGRPEWRECGGGAGLIVDIEECAIGTLVVNTGLANERRRFEGSYKEYKKGATVLLREDTRGDELAAGSVGADGAVLRETVGGMVKTCVTDPRQIVQEHVGDKVFEFSAGEFFQNNNTILPHVTGYVREQLLIPGTAPGEELFLVDAYCGLGLFSITCAEGVLQVVGVEVLADLVRFAERNVRANGVENAKFIVGKAEAIFSDLSGLPRERMLVILDPPRKGCDEVFLDQLAALAPARVVYVSCNVHSQARDVEYLAQRGFTVESVRGFDFFPQTHHVESVCVLRHGA